MISSDRKLKILLLWIRYRTETEWPHNHISYVSLSQSQPIHIHAGIHSVRLAFLSIWIRCWWTHNHNHQPYRIAWLVVLVCNLFAAQLYAAAGQNHVQQALCVCACMCSQPCLPCKLMLENGCYANLFICCWQICLDENAISILSRQHHTPFLSLSWYSNICVARITHVQSKVDRMPLHGR